MPISIMRFNFVLPGADPTVLSGMYQAALEMAAVADANGFMAVSLEEHHGVDDGWSPAPLGAGLGGGDNYPGAAAAAASTNGVTGGGGGYTSRGVLNIRSAPSSTASELGYVPRNTGIAVLGRDATTNWLKITYNGITGWVSTFYVNITSDQVKGLPVVQ